MNCMILRAPLQQASLLQQAGQLHTIMQSLHSCCCIESRASRCAQPIILHALLEAFLQLRLLHGMAALCSSLFKPERQLAILPGHMRGEADQNLHLVGQLHHLHAAQSHLWQVQNLATKL